MEPKLYQTLASRTECDQEKARMRMAWAENTPQTPENYLIPIRLNHAVLGLTGEVGELAGAIERWIHYGKDLDMVNIAEEIGDCLWYLALACNTLRLDLGAIMQANIAKLKARYPEKYTDACAAEENRDRAKEQECVKRITDPLILREYERQFGHPEGSLTVALLKDDGPPLADDQWACPLCKKVWDQRAGDRCPCGGTRGQMVYHLQGSAQPPEPVVQDGHGFGHVGNEAEFK